MGCDIHAMIERLGGTPGSEWRYWVNAGDPDICRNYSVFAVLANVRNGYEPPEVPISSPRGLPGGPDPAPGRVAACEEFRALYDRWSGDAHSCSWVTLAEMKAHAHPPMASSGEVDETWTDLIAEMDAAKRDGNTDDEVRLVFFFDN